jgi:hypothetical protein
MMNITALTPSTAVSALLAIEHAAKPGTAHFAVPMFDTVPNGCTLHQVKDGAHEPHILAGELAVVNLNDREFVDGELFLIGFTGRAAVMQVIRRDRFGIDGVWFRPLNSPNGNAELQRWISEGWRMYASDGPLKPECLQEYILGRVVGVFDGTLS